MREPVARTVCVLVCACVCLRYLQIVALMREPVARTVAASEFRSEVVIMASGVYVYA